MGTYYKQNIAEIFILNYNEKVFLKPEEETFLKSSGVLLKNVHYYSSETEMIHAFLHTTQVSQISFHENLKVIF